MRSRAVVCIRDLPFMVDIAAKSRHLLHVFSTFAVGGSQRRFVQLANAFGAKYVHTILAMDGNFEAAKGLNNGVRYALETIPVRKTATISLANLMSARRLLRRVAPSLLLTYNWGTIEWVIANRLPTGRQHIHVEDGFGPEETPQRQIWRRKRARRLLLSRCDHVVVPSLMLREIATHAWQLSPKKVCYLPNGIDCDRFANQLDRELAVALGIPDSALVVGTVAALRKEKNLLRLVRVFASLPCNIESRLVIIGDGPERAALEQAVAELNVLPRVVFAGAMDEPERLLGRFDVFALTSDTEQMPYSILEAMAAGLPVVATDVGDVRSMLAPQNGNFIVPTEAEEAMTHGMVCLLRDRPLRARIGSANQKRVRLEYALERMVQRYDALFSGSL